MPLAWDLGRSVTLTVSANDSNASTDTHSTVHENPAPTLEPFLKRSAELAKDFQQILLTLVTLAHEEVAYSLLAILFQGPSREVFVHDREHEADIIRIMERDGLSGVRSGSCPLGIEAAGKLKYRYVPAQKKVGHDFIHR